MRKVQLLQRWLTSRSLSRKVRRNLGVTEDFDDSAARDLAVVALFDHADELGAKFEQTLNPALDSSELMGGYSTYLLAGCLWYALKGEHRLDGRDVKTQFAGVANEGQSSNVLDPVEASSALSAWRRGYEVYPLVIANRLDIYIRALG